MITRSRFRILSNLIRVVFVLILIMVLPVFIQVVIDNLDSYFMIMMIPICLYLGWMIISAILSIKKVYNKIIIKDKGLEIRPFMGLGRKYFYHWNELSDYELKHETSGRGPNYYSFSVKKEEKIVLQFDDFTYRNFKNMRDIIEKHMVKTKSTTP